MKNDEMMQMKNDGMIEQESCDFWKSHSLINVALLIEGVATALPHEDADAVILIAIFVGQLATVMFIHGLALHNAGADPTSILASREPNAVKVTGTQGVHTCSYEILSPIGIVSVLRLGIRAFENLSKLWANGLIDEQSLSAAKKMHDYDKALWMAVGTFAGELHGDDETAQG